MDLVQIAKYVLSRRKIKNNKELYIEDLCQYFNYLINKFETPERKITRKILIFMGLKEMSPRKPLIIYNPKIGMQKGSH